MVKPECSGSLFTAYEMHIKMVHWAWLTGDTVYALIIAGSDGLSNFRIDRSQYP